MKKKLFKLFVTVSTFGVAASLASCGENVPSTGSTVPKTNTNTEASTPSKTDVNNEVKTEIYYYDSDYGTNVFTKTDNKFTLSLSGDTYTGTLEKTENGFNLNTSSKVFTATKVDSLIVITVDNKAYNFYKMENYNVKFMNGTKEYFSTTILNGKKLTNVDSPKVDNNLFVGWYKDSEFKEPYDLSANVVTSDLVLYARFVPEKVGVSEYTVEFYDGENLLTTKTTISGVLYDLPNPSNDKKFVGWYTSDCDDKAKLSHKYSSETLQENTKLYAVYDDGKPIVDVSNDVITWNNTGINVKYTVKVVDPNGNEETQNVLTTKYDYKFSSKVCGEYTITVSDGKNETTLYYSNKKLPKVSQFTVIEPNILYFNNVDSSLKYKISIECGEESHQHNELDLGNNNFYDFSNCKMKNGGIKFVVKAYKDGFLTSESDVFTYDKTLNMPENIKVIDNVLTWDYVDNALSYNVTISHDDLVETFNVLGTNTFDLSEFSGDLGITICAVSEGYNSTDSKLFNYKKETLAVAKNITLTGSKVLWDKVDGAASYVVLFDNKEYIVTENSFDIPTTFDTSKESFDFQVKSVASDPTKNSEFSKIVQFKYRTLSGLNYKDGLVSWDPVINASKYALRLNNGTEVELTSCNYEIAFNKSGVNTISVCYYNSEDVKSAWTSININTYSLYFEKCLDEDIEISTKYYALGDKVELPTATSSGYNLSGWYNLANGPLNNGKEYKDGFYMPSNNLTLYAYWTSKEFKANLDVDGFSSLSKEESCIGVLYNKKYKLPVPADDEKNGKYFAGWYTDHNGIGIQYTDKDGNSVSNWTDLEDVTLYAYWIEAVSYQEIIDSKSKQVIGYSAIQGAGSASATKIIIPDKFNGLPVLKIGNFSNCSSLTYLEVPNTVESIDTITGFTGCSKLKHIEVREVEGTHEVFYKSYDGILYYYDSVNKIPGWTLKLVPKSYSNPNCVVMDGTAVIPPKAFASMGVITSITIPASVQEIDENAFYYVRELEKVVFESDPESSVELAISANAFYSCSKLAEVVLPSHLKTLEFETIYKTDKDYDSYKTPFYSCSKLEKISATAELANYKIIDDKYICNSTGDTILFAVKSLSGDIQIPDGIINIGESAFRDCKLITSVTFPMSVKEIGAYSFKSCTGLTQIKFEENELGNLTIKEQAFHSCTGLTSVVIPSHVRNIEKYAFGGTTKLTKMEIYSNLKINFSDKIVQSASTSTSLTTTYLTDLIIGKDVPEFDIVGSFSGLNNNLKNVTIDSENTYFKTDTTGVIYNYDMTKIILVPDLVGEFTISETVKTISSSAFSYRKNISKIVVGKNVEDIGDNAFYNCSGILNIEFEKDRTSSLTIGDNAFKNCSNLTTCLLPEGTKKIGDNAFASCRKLTEFVLPEGLEEVGDGFLSYCVLIKELNLPSTLVKLGSYVVGDTSSSIKAFDNISYLERVNVAENNEVFSSDNGVLYSKTNGVPTSLCLVPKAFYGDLVLPKTLNVIGKAAFKYNKNITSVSFVDNMSACEMEGDKIVYKGGLLEVGDEAFYYCSKLQNVSLPNLSNISNCLFYYCEALTSFTVPNTVTSIGKQAFYSCKKLKNLVFEEGNDDNALTIFSASSYSYGSFYNSSLESIKFPTRLTDIGKYAFYKVSSLKEVSISAGLTKIGDNSFYQCENLTSVNIPSDSLLEELGKYAFYQCDLSTINLPTTLKNLGQYSLAHNEKLTSVTIPANVEKIDNYAMYRCTALESVDFEENSKLTTIGTSSFYYCTSLKTIELPENLSVIDTSAFNSCTNLTSISFAKCKKITKIGNNSFAYTGLESFEFPEYYSKGIVYVFPANSIGTNLFNNCKNLKTVKLSKSITSIKQVLTGANNLENVIIDEDNTNFYVDNDNGIIYNKKMDTIKYAFGKKIPENFVISDTVTTIDPYSFYNQTRLNKVTIPASVKTIGEYAFNNSSVVNVDFQEGSKIAEIGKYVFYNCRYLEKINIPSSVTSIGNSTFQNCLLLNDVDISNVTKLDVYAFSGCKALKTLKYDESKLTSIGNYAFQNCVLLENFVIGSNVSKLGTNVFYGCSNLKKVTFAEDSKIKKLDNYLFKNCTSLTSVNMPSSVTELGNYVFSGSGITSYVLPNTVKKIGTNVFYDCASLKEIDFSNCSLTQLSNYSFQKCSMLEKVILPKTLEYIGSYAFHSCTNLSEISIPDSVTVIGNYAFAKSGLIEITLPKHLSKLGGTSPTTSVSLSNSSYTFSECENLKKVVLNCDTLSMIPKYVFNSNPNLKEVVLSDSITSIGTYAFNECAISSIDLSKVTTLSINSFYKCASLEEVKLNTSISKIPSSCFYECSLLSKINIPAGLTTIDSNAFRGTAITSIDLSNVTSLGTYAFYNCTSLKSVTLSSSLTELPADLFTNCQLLKDITLPLNLQSIGSYALANTGISSIKFGEDLYSIGTRAFEKCANLTTIDTTNSKSLTSLGDLAFNECSKLTNFQIPNSVTTLGNFVFQDCVGLTGKMKISENVTSIGKNPFAGCLNVTGVEVDLNNTNYKTDSINALYNADNGLIYYPENATGEVTIPSNVEVLANAFERCDYITKIILSEGIEEIANSAFAYMYGLTEVVLPSTLQTINSYAFQYDSNLTNLILPDSLLTLGTYAFASCGIESLDIPKNVEEISNSCFSKCENLKRVNLSNVSKISGYAFEYCSALEEIIIPSTVSSIGTYAFKNSSIKKVSIPASVNDIGSSIFSGCESLTDVTLEEGFTTLGSYMFNGCTSLASINLPSSLTTIGTYCFKESGITDITLPKSVNSVGNYAFMECNKLNNVVLSERMEKVPQSMFQDSSIKSVVLPASIKTIESSAFKNCTELTTVTILGKLNSISYSAFADCTSIKELEINVDELVTLSSAFTNWTSDQKIIFNATKQVVDSISSSYDTNCNAQFIYAEE